MTTDGKRFFKAFAVAAAVPLIVACNYERIKAPQLAIGEETWFAFLQRTTLSPQCLSCHAGPGAGQGYDLSSYAALMATGAVVPKEPERSPLYLSVASGRMPKGGNPLSQDQIRAIQGWIAAGAEENAPRPKPGELPSPEPPPPVTPPTPPPPSPPSPPPPPPPPPVPPTLEPTYSSIRQLILEPRCVGCHSGPRPKGDLDLASYQKMMDIPGVVEPGDSDVSRLYQQCVDGKMPPPPEKKLTDAELKTIAEWIKRGAKEKESHTAAPAEVTPEGASL